MDDRSPRPARLWRALVLQASALALLVAGGATWLSPAHALEEPDPNEEELLELEEQTELEPDGTDEPSPNVSEEESPPDSELEDSPGSSEPLESSDTESFEEESGEPEPLNSSESTWEDCWVPYMPPDTSEAEWDWSPGSELLPCSLVVHDPHAHALVATLRTELLLAQALSLALLGGLLWVRR
jgi:hypothetical protein